MKGSPRKSLQDARVVYTGVGYYWGTVSLALGYFSTLCEAKGTVFVFVHLYQDAQKTGSSERCLAGSVSSAPALGLGVLSSSPTLGVDATEKGGQRWKAEVVSSSAKQPYGPYNTTPPSPGQKAGTRTLPYGGVGSAPHGQCAQWRVWEGAGALEDQRHWSRRTCSWKSERTVRERAESKGACDTPTSIPEENEPPAAGGPHAQPVTPSVVRL